MWNNWSGSHALQAAVLFSPQERMMQLQESQNGLNAGKETTEREQSLEAQLIEARSIISEQVTDHSVSLILIVDSASLP